MIKFIIIFLAGIVETAIYTGFLISLEKRKCIAPFLMIIYMIIYLSIISTAIKDINTFWMIVVYSFSCGIGVFIRMKLEQKIIHKNCKLKIK